MENMLVAAFNHEAAAGIGLQALLRLHASSAIRLRAMVVMTKSTTGQVSVTRATDRGDAVCASGWAADGSMSLSSEPACEGSGALNGQATALLGAATRDFWVLGVGMDYVEEAECLLQPGQVGLVAALEEACVVPVNAALEVLGGLLFRRTRSELYEARLLLAAQDRANGQLLQPVQS